jgi:anaerobic ribonucleoside-triphosphate reductase activating protein
MKIRLAAPMQRESIVDGQGIRMVIWSQGCKMACPGCHNPETHNPCGGKEFDVEELKNEITKYAKYHQGITLSGGDPFLQPEANKELADHAHSLGLDVWAYCGKTYEQLQDNVLLSSCDVLIDGPFIKELRDVTLAFRGSSNQRIINVQRSLESGEVILW